MRSEFLLKMMDCLDENEPILYSFYIYENKSIFDKDIFEDTPFRNSHLLSLLNSN
jgi:hypothetical protein